MSRYFQWIILTSLTGSPIGSIAILAAVWFTADRFTFQLIPSPFRAFNRWRRSAQLRNTIRINPNERRARLELAELLIGRRQFAGAVDVLKPNAEAGDDDATTLYALGVACLGCGKSQQGEVFLQAARERDEGYRIGAIDLELGRWRLARGDAKGAVESLQKFCARRHGTVEGKVLLAKALEATGDSTSAAQLRDAAWSDYAAAPRFQQRLERFWAWRARPSRPLTYLAIAMACGLVFAHFAPDISRSVGRKHPAAYDAARDD